VACGAVVCTHQPLHGCSGSVRSSFCHWLVPVALEIFKKEADTRSEIAGGLEVDLLCPFIDRLVPYYTIG
jgi:hypothetical protein